MKGKQVVKDEFELMSHNLITGTCPYLFLSMESSSLMVHFKWCLLCEAFSNITSLIQAKLNNFLECYSYHYKNIFLCHIYFYFLIYFYDSLISFISFQDVFKDMNHELSTAPKTKPEIVASTQFESTNESRQTRNC